MLIKKDDIIMMAKVLAAKFVNKVETGRAISRETYADCKELLDVIKDYEFQEEEIKFWWT